MHERTDAQHCEESRNTSTFVPRCPRNEQEWKSREQNVRCQTIKQICVSPEKFLYHCVLNAEGTKLLEVCAPSRYIYGKKKMLEKKLIPSKSEYLNQSFIVKKY